MNTKIKYGLSAAVLALIAAGASAPEILDQFLDEKEGNHTTAYRDGAGISGSVNANSGTLNNVTINENCRVLGKLSANQIEGDLVKTVGKAFPRDSRAPERWPSGTITVRVYDDQPFDRQIVIPAVAFSGAKHEREHTDIYSSCRLIVRKNGAEIYNRTALDNTLIYSGVIDMPAGHGHMTLEFSVSAWLVNNWYPTASISDLLVVVMKKATAGISIS